MQPRDEKVVAGAIWRSKRDRWRTVRITGTFVGYKGDMVNVRRNTSERRQAIMVATLLRDYRFERMASP